MWELSVHVFMCVHSVLESVEGILSSELSTLIEVVCALNVFPVGSAENEESSSDVQAEGGKPSGMYYY